MRFIDSAYSRFNDIDTIYTLSYSRSKESFVIVTLRELLEDNIVKTYEDYDDDYRLISVSRDYEILCDYAETFKNVLNRRKNKEYDKLVEMMKKTPRIG